MCMAERDNMAISDQIEVLRVRCNVSEAEMAGRLGKSPQSFNFKMKRGGSIPEIEQAADVSGVSFNREFVHAGRELWRFASKQFARGSRFN